MGTSKNRKNKSKANDFKNTKLNKKEDEPVIKKENNKARTISRILLFLLILSFLLSILPVKARGEMTPRGELENYVESTFRKLKVPGGSLILIDNNKAETFYFGEDNNGLVNEDTPFLIGSLSDSFTAISVLKLVENGKLKLDSKLIDVLPDFVNSNPYTSDITISQLLSHTSGISKKDGYEYSSLDLSGDEAIKIALSTVNKLQVHTKVFDESNLNYLILGRIIEVHSQKSFNQYSKENILKPLEMNSTYALKEDAAKNKMDKGYKSFFGITYKSKQIYDDSGAPYAYISSTTKDLTKYLKYLASDSGAPILKNETKDLLFSAIYKKDFRNNYGYGFSLINPDTTEVEAISNGLLPDFNSQISIMPKKHQVIAIMVNKGHILENNKLFEFKENLKKAFTQGNLKNIKPHIPIIELLCILIPILLLVQLIRRHIRIKDFYEFTNADIILAVLGLIVAFALIPSISYVLGYSIKTLGDFAPDIKFSVIITSVLFALHGLTTFYKKHIIDKGVKPVFNKQLDYLYEKLERRRIIKKKQRETKLGVFHNEESIKNKGRIKLTPLLVFAKVANKTGQNFTKFIAKRKKASEESYYFDDEMYDLDYSEDILPDGEVLLNIEKNSTDETIEKTKKEIMDEEEVDLKSHEDYSDINLSTTDKLAKEDVEPTSNTVQIKEEVSSNLDETEEEKVDEIDTINFEHSKVKNNESSKINSTQLEEVVKEKNIEEEPIKFRTMFLDEDSYSLGESIDDDIENYVYNKEKTNENDEKEVSDKEIIELLKSKLSKYEDIE